MEGSAISAVAAALLEGRRALQEWDGEWPASVRKQIDAKAWQAAEMLRDGAGGAEKEASLALSHSTVLLMKALLDHVDDLQNERVRDKQTLDSAIASMQKWRAREELQHMKNLKLQQEYAHEVQELARLEDENEQLKKELQATRAEMDMTARSVASLQLRNSRCASITTFEDLVDGTLEESRGTLTTLTTDFDSEDRSFSNFYEPMSPKSQGTCTKDAGNVFEEPISPKSGGTCTEDAGNVFLWDEGVSTPGSRRRSGSFRLKAINGKSLEYNTSSEDRIKGAPSHARALESDEEVKCEEIVADADSSTLIADAVAQRMTRIRRASSIEP